MLLVATALVGCGTQSVARAPRTPSSGNTTTGPESVAVPRTIVTPGNTTSVDELFDEAETNFADRHFDLAASQFDRITALDPDGEFAVRALFDGAAAHDELGDFEGAATRYQEVARRFPNDPASRSALVRAVRLLAYLERWDDAGRVADASLARVTELAPVDRIAVYAGKALSLVFSSDPETAEYFVNKGRDVVDSERLDAAGALPRDLAALYFALGELRRIRGEKIHFTPTPSNFAQVLEARCQLLLDAQSAYSDAMRAYDAHWSAMAGYRVGELYENLHRDVMSITPPASANTPAKAQLFEGAMRLRYSILLEKGLTMLEHTLALAERTGEHSAWTTKAAEAKQTVETAMKDEQAALARLPYSKEQLERALDDLGRRKAALGSGKGP
ncbi:MAG TPA: hypothetical protein VH142_00225 [Polyangiaceae bacterium]|nr:hypothetical protein [Polyangiaceae bacterium]